LFFFAFYDVRGQRGIVFPMYFYFPVFGEEIYVKDWVDLP